MPETVYLSLGSNLGDRIANLRTAIDRLAALGEANAVSSFYETEPLEVADQPWFVNCVVELKTDLKPVQLLAELLEIERQMGRRRDGKKGPRIIDLDILLYGSSVIRTNGLSIPHSAMHERRFVLEPLDEIAPAALHPVLKQSIRELRDALTGQAVRRVDS
ncbi:MAG TPA: 2-amino-4-hydroxy-6-hydroxymethyldihydropteridine diphosphokinase [Terriglobales bacterium]